MLNGKFSRSLLRTILGTALFVTALPLFAEDVEVTPTTENGIVWFDATQWPVEGKGWTETNRYFCRIPADAEGSVTESVKGLAQDSAGMLVRFRTDADTISVKYKLYSATLAMAHMPATGVSGLDLYAFTNNKWNWVACTMPKQQESTDTLISGLGQGMRDYLLYLPLYNGVDTLSIGVPEGSEFHAVAPRPEKPIVYYGTSIAQGGCCSRPGNCYTAMLGRRFDWPVLNLGFSGSARMEPEVAQMMARLDPLLYVLDPVPNMNPGLIDERAVNFIKILRNAHPETPILMVDGRRYSNFHIRPSVADHCQKMTDAYRRAFDTLIAEGDKNLYWLGNENQTGESLDFDATMDSSHLNDLGMFRMTDALEAAIRPIFEKATR